MWANHLDKSCTLCMALCVKYIVTFLFGADYNDYFFQTALVNELDANNLLPLLECVPDSAPLLSSPPGWHRMSYPSFYSMFHRH